MNTIHLLSIGSSFVIALTASTAPAQGAPEPAPPPPASIEHATTLPIEPAPVAEPRARLDYSDGVFYLRSADDNLILVPAARAHIDTYAFAGPGVADYRRANGTGLVTNMFFRRMILEMGGAIRKDWFFWIGGNFAPTSVDANQATMSTASIYDTFVGYEPTPYLRLYAGQYNAPVTMENVTSSKWLDFMERALLVRTLAAPYNKDLGVMAWGDTDKGYFEYQAGVFGGDGQNRFNVDNRVDGMARVLVRPLAGEHGPTNRLHVGASARFGSRDPEHVFYDAPTMSTPGGFAYWSPTYKSGTSDIHIVPSRAQLDVTGEVYVPFERFDLKGEFLYMNEGRREVTADDRASTLRSGSLRGFGGYAQVSFWPLGTPRVNGNPASVYAKIRAPNDRGAEAPYGLQLVLRGEMIRLKYAANDNLGDDAGGLSSKTENIQVNAFQAAVNYWATKHVRLTAEYSLYQFPGTPNAPGGNEATAPGAKGRANDAAADHLHELSFRVGLAL